MRRFDQWTLKLRMLFKRSEAGVRLDDELRYHLDRQIAENVAAGMSPEDARCAALRSFGNPALLRDQTREAWDWSRLESLWRDVRYSVRALLRTPGFTTIAILVMALGIGANVALFTVVRGMLLKPLPFREPDRLMMLYERSNDDMFAFNAVSGGIFAEWQKQNRSFSDLALMGQEGFNLAGAGGQLPEKLRGMNCTWNLLPTLGVQPALGRNFTAADDRPSATPTLLMSWSLWKRRFGGNPAILNRTVYLNTVPYTVIGILPPWFTYPDPTIQVLTPIYHDRPEKFMKLLGSHSLQVIGRLKPGVTPAQGVADLSVINHRIHDQNLDNPFIAQAANIQPLLESMVGDMKKPLYVLLAATGCVLLIACLNVGNLLVARAAARRRDLAVRSALGGGQLRLLRERFIESLLLCLAGGAAGLLLAFGAVEWLIHLHLELSRVDTIRIDPVVAAFTVGVILFCALFAGLISWRSIDSRQLLASLQDSSRGASAGRAKAALRKVLLTAEVGLTVVLLIAAGLLLKSYATLRSADLGCVTDNVLTMHLDLFGKRYNEPAKIANFYSAMLERVRAIPGVQAAGFVLAVPGQGYWGDSDFAIVEHPPLPQGQAQFAPFRGADPGYFAAMGIPIVRGHTFDPGRQLDRADQCLISEAFVKQYFPGEDPIGKHLKFQGKVWEIAGVVGDTRYELYTPPKPMDYFPISAGQQNGGTLVIRSSRKVEQLALPVQRAINELDRDLPVSDVLTMDQLLGRSVVDLSFSATLLVAFAALSLVLAAVGLFGVLSYIVAQRTNEIGICMALGAPRQQVLRKVLMDGLRPALAGLILGLAASAAIVRILRSMFFSAQPSDVETFERLFGAQPLDVAVFAGVAVTLCLVAMGACILPAWRASRVDPMQALRTE